MRGIGNVLLLYTFMLNLFISLPGSLAQSSEGEDIYLQGIVVIPSNSIASTTICICCGEATNFSHHIHDNHYWCKECIERSFSIQSQQYKTKFRIDKSDPLKCCNGHVTADLLKLVFPNLNTSFLQKLDRMRTNNGLASIMDDKGSILTEISSASLDVSFREWQNVTMESVLLDFEIFLSVLDMHSTICPTCFTLFHRDLGCDLVNCLICGTRFCFACNEKNPSHHYCPSFVSFVAIPDSQIIKRFLLTSAREYPSATLQLWLMQRLCILFSIERLVTNGTAVSAALVRRHGKKLKKLHEIIVGILHARPLFWNSRVCNSITDRDALDLQQGKLHAYYHRILASITLIVTILIGSSFKIGLVVGVKGVREFANPGKGYAASILLGLDASFLFACFLYLVICMGKLQSYSAKTQIDHQSKKNFDPLALEIVRNIDESFEFVGIPGIPGIPGITLPSISWIERTKTILRSPFHRECIFDYVKIYLIINVLMAITFLGALFQ